MLLFRGDYILSNEVLFLKMIQCGGSFSLLYERGLSYSQVTALLKQQLLQENIVVNDTSISLTERGEKFLEDNLSKLKQKEKDKWILPQEHKYKDSIPFKKIILPKESDI